MIVVQTEIKPFQHIRKLIMRKLQVNSHQRKLWQIPFVEHQVRVLMITDNPAPPMHRLIRINHPHLHILIILGSTNHVRLDLQAIRRRRQTVTKIHTAIIIHLLHRLLRLFPQQLDKRVATLRLALHVRFHLLKQQPHRSHII